MSDAVVLVRMLFKPFVRALCGGSCLTSSRTRSVFEGPFGNPFIWLAAAIVIALQLMAVYLAPLARVLNTTRLTVADWLMALAVLIPILVVEVSKSFSRWKRTA